VMRVAIQGVMKKGWARALGSASLFPRLGVF
jgi:hypothetical protein